jgi:hypothetical protein
MGRRCPRRKSAVSAKQGFVRPGRRPHGGFPVVAGVRRPRDGAMDDGPTGAPADGSSLGRFRSATIGVPVERIDAPRVDVDVVGRSPAGGGRARHRVPSRGRRQTTHARGRAPSDPSGSRSTSRIRGVRMAPLRRGCAIAAAPGRTRAEHRGCGARLRGSTRERISRPAWQSCTARCPSWKKPHAAARWPSFAPSVKPSSAQGTSDQEHAHARCAKAPQSRSAKRLSKAALCAITTTAAPRNASISAASIDLPTTISSVMPVMATTAAGIGRPGSRKRLKDSWTEKMRPSEEKSKGTMAISMISSVAGSRPVVSTSTKTARRVRVPSGT